MSEERESELRECPFCRGKAKVEGRKKMKVVCTQCGATGPEKSFTSQAIEAWNRRIDIKEKEQNG